MCLKRKTKVETLFVKCMAKKNKHCLLESN